MTHANGSDGRRAQIVDRIAAGILPGDGMKHTHAGRGRACAGCDHPISRSDMELESVFADGRRLPFHLECFTAWWKILEDRRGTIEL